MRASDRLTEAPSAWSLPSSGPTAGSRVLAGAGRLDAAAKPILEINPRHAARRRLAETRRQGRRDREERRASSSTRRASSTARCLPSEGFSERLSRLMEPWAKNRVCSYRIGLRLNRPYPNSLKRRSAPPRPRYPDRPASAAPRRFAPRRSPAAAVGRIGASDRRRRQDERRRLGSHGLALALAQARVGAPSRRRFGRRIGRWAAPMASLRSGSAREAGSGAASRRGSSISARTSSLLSGLGPPAFDRRPPFEGVKPAGHGRDRQPDIGDKPVRVQAGSRGARTARDSHSRSGRSSRSRPPRYRPSAGRPLARTRRQDRREARVRARVKSRAASAARARAMALSTLCGAWFARVFMRARRSRPNRRPDADIGRGEVGMGRDAPGRLDDLGGLGGCRCHRRAGAQPAPPPAPGPAQASPPRAHAPWRPARSRSTWSRARAVSSTARWRRAVPCRSVCSRHCGSRVARAAGQSFSIDWNSRSAVPAQGRRRRGLDRLRRRGLRAAAASPRRRASTNRPRRPSGCVSGSSSIALKAPSAATRSPDSWAACALNKKASGSLARGSRSASTAWRWARRTSPEPTAIMPCVTALKPLERRRRAKEEGTAIRACAAAPSRSR